METSPHPDEKFLPRADAKSPYEVNFCNRMLFFYMNSAMTLANKRANEGQSLKGTLLSKSS